MFAPEQTYKKCPWWHRIFRRFKWFKWFRCWCSPIYFMGVRLPTVNVKLPSMNFSEIAAVQKMDRRAGAIFYLDVKYGTEKDIDV